VIKIEVPTEISLALDPETTKQNNVALLAVREKIYAALNVVNSLILANQTICRHPRIKSDICLDCGKNLDP
jgi:hypothetical protein